MKLLFATGNQYKYTLMKERLKPLEDIEVIIPKMLGIDINVIEDGNTPEENATKKAQQYYEATRMPVIAEDSGLYIDKFSDEDQPGLFVKRVNGREDLTDKEILTHYINKLNEYGGKSLACYHTGVCLIDENGNIYSSTTQETKFLLTTKVHESDLIKGSVLDSISYDIEFNKYFNERTLEEKQAHFKELDEKYRDMVKKYILKK